MIRQKELDAMQRGEMQSAADFAAIRQRLAPVLQKQFGMLDIPLETPTKPATRRSSGEITKNASGETPQATLARLGLEYRTAEHTPQFIEQTWKNMLSAWIAIVQENDPTFHVQAPAIPHCGRTQEQLEAMSEENIGRVYVPPFDYQITARVFPGMGSGNVASGRAVDDIHTEGWYDVPMDIVPKNLRITEGELRKQAIDGWEVGSAKTLIWAGQASHIFDKDGQYLGQNGHWFLVRNTRVRGGVALARFIPAGRFRVLEDWGPALPDRDRGGLLQRK